MEIHDDIDKSFKCIKCGTLNLVSVCSNVMEQEKREEWSIKTSITARQKFKQFCGGKLIDFNEGLLYLLALQERNELGIVEQEPFGIPGTAK